jgi:AhpD family alkylhydroperoxidase
LRHSQIARQQDNVCGLREEKVMTNAILNLPLIEPSEARGTPVEGLYEIGRKAGKGMLPNMYKAMANVPGLLSTYLHGYAEFHQHSTFNSDDREIVFLVISEENGCDYCMAAHSLLADMAGVPRHVTDAIRDRVTIEVPAMQVLGSGPINSLALEAIG